MLEREDVAAEIICDGVHVHPAMVRLALAAKQPSQIMAITDGTAGSGLPRGARASIGGRTITVGDAAYLDDGTLAGSVLTMDRAFARLVTAMGMPLVDAATICATTPARALDLQGFGVISRWRRRGSGRARRRTCRFDRLSFGRPGQGCGRHEAP